MLVGTLVTQIVGFIPVGDGQGYVLCGEIGLKNLQFYLFASVWIWCHDRNCGYEIYIFVLQTCKAI